MYRAQATLPGRQQEKEVCWSNIQEQPFFILEGESGCGKSSLLYAELLPLAREKFQVMVCSIADDPFGRFYCALLEEPYTNLDHTIEAKDLREAIASTKLLPDKPLLLCIDQFEELFVTAKDEVRQRYCQMLWTDRPGQAASSTPFPSCLRCCIPSTNFTVA